MTTQSIDFFKSIFEHFPNFAILHINNNCEDIKSISQDIANTSDGKFTNIEFNDIDEKTFRLKSNTSTYTILSDCLNLVENQKQFLTTIYTGLENSAQVIILVKKDSTDLYALYELLEEVNFTNTNTIDIFDEYDLVVTKKMRMWV